MNSDRIQAHSLGIDLSIEEAAQFDIDMAGMKQPDRPLPDSIEAQLRMSTVVLAQQRDEQHCRAEFYRRKFNQAHENLIRSEKTARIFWFFWGLIIGIFLAACAVFAMAWTGWL